MALVIEKELNGSDITNSFTCRFLNDSLDSLILIIGNKVEVHSNAVGKDGLSSVLSLTTWLSISDPIIKSSHIRPPGQKRSWLLLLTDQNQLLVIGFIQGKMKILERLNFTSFSLKYALPVISTTYITQQINVSPILEVDSKHKLILIQSCDGFLQVFYLSEKKRYLYNQINELTDESTERKRKLNNSLTSNQLFGRPISIFTGRDKIECVTFLDGTELVSYFCIVSRNSNLRYSLTFYQISDIDGQTQIAVKRKVPLSDGKPKFLSSVGMQTVLVVYEARHYLVSLLAFSNLSSIKEVNIRGYSCTKEITDIGFHGISCVKRLSNGKLLLSHENGRMSLLLLRMKLHPTDRERDASTRLVLESWSELHLGAAPMSFHKIVCLTNSLVFGYNKFGGSGLVSLNNNATFTPFQKSFQLNEAMQILPKGEFSPMSVFTKDFQKSVILDGANAVIYEFDGEVKSSLCFIHSSLGTIIILLKAQIEDQKSVFVLDVLKFDLEVELIAQYKFDQDQFVFDCLHSPISISTSPPEAEIKLSEIQDGLEDSFVVGTTSRLENDPVTEVLLFKIDDSGNLDISAIASLSSEFSCATIKDGKVLLFGCGSLVILTLGVYYDEERSGFELKFDLVSRHDGLSSGHPSFAVNVQRGVIFMDIFDGIFFLPFSRSKPSVIKKVRDGCFTYISRIGSDGLIVGDSIGNIFLFRFRDESIHLIKSLNLGRGNVRCITSLVDENETIDFEKNPISKFAMVSIKNGGVYSISYTPPSSSLHRLLLFQYQISKVDKQFFTKSLRQKLYETLTFEDISEQNTGHLQFSVSLLRFSILDRVKIEDLAEECELSLISLPEIASRLEYMDSELKESFYFLLNILKYRYIGQ